VLKKTPQLCCSNCFAFINSDVPVDCPWCGEFATKKDFPDTESFIFEPLYPACVEYYPSLYTNSLEEAIDA
jgi:hypothetical protein